MSLEQALALAPSGEIIACDFAVEGVQHFEEKLWGYTWGRVTNIDHHAAHAPHGFEHEPGVVEGSK